MERELRILVTGGRFPPGTAVVRALGGAGARVHASDSYKLSPALHSHALEKIHLAPPASRQPVEYARAIDQAARRSKRKLR